MNALKIITTTIGATVIGVALGVLFAPGKVSKTRRKIFRKSHGFVDHLSDVLDDMVDYISHSIEHVENESLRLAKKEKAQANKVAARINSKMH